jgi:hypothetical protein
VSKSTDSISIFPTLPIVAFKRPGICFNKGYLEGACYTKDKRKQIAPDRYQFRKSGVCVCVAQMLPQGVLLPRPGDYYRLPSPTLIPNAKPCFHYIYPNPYQTPCKLRSADSSSILTQGNLCVVALLGRRRRERNHLQHAFESLPLDLCFGTYFNPAVSVARVLWTGPSCAAVRSSYPCFS